MSDEQLVTKTKTVRGVYCSGCQPFWACEANLKSKVFREPHNKCYTQFIKNSNVKTQKQTEQFNVKLDFRFYF